MIESSPESSSVIMSYVVEMVQSGGGANPYVVPVFAFLTFCLLVSPAVLILFLWRKRVNSGV